VQNDDPILRRLLPEVQAANRDLRNEAWSDFLIKLEASSVAGGVSKNVPRDGSLLSRFRVSYRKKDLGEFTLHVPEYTTS